MADLYKLQYANNTLTYPGWNGYVCYEDEDEPIEEYLNKFYPVGTYYTTTNTAFNPNESFVGTWIRDTDGYVTVASSVPGMTGGELTHTLSIAECPAHTHTAQQAFVDCWTASKAPDQHRTAAWSNWYGNGRVGSYPNLAAYCTTTFQFSGNTEAHNNVQPSEIIIRWHRSE